MVTTIVSLKCCMGFRKTILNLFLYDFLLEPRTHTFLFYKAFILSSCMFAHKQKLFNVFLKFPSSKCFAVRSAILLCTWSIDEIVLPFVENFHIFIKTWDVPALFVGYECVSELRNVTLKNSVFFFFGRVKGKQEFSLMFLSWETTVW